MKQEEYNVISEIIIPILSPLIASLISLWIFKEGLNWNKRKEKRKEIENNYQTEKYFLYNLEALIFVIKLQVQEILNTSRDIKRQVNKNLKMHLLPELEIKEIRDLDFKLLFSILVINRKGNNNAKAEDFLNLKNCFHNIDSFLNEQKKRNINSENRIRFIHKEWNDNFSNFKSFLNNSIINNEETDKLDNICSKHLKNKLEQEQIETMFIFVISPMKLELKKEIKNKDQRLPHLIQLLHTFENLFEELENLKKANRTELLLSGRRLNSVKHLIKETSSRLVNRKMI